MLEAAPVSLQVQRALWLAFTFSLVLYVAIAWVVVPMGSAVRVALPVWFPVLVYVLAAGLGAASVMLRRRGLRGGRNMILALALNEAIAVLGLALAFLLRQREAVLPYAAAALLLNVWAYPRGDE
jgi:hypothetical protein